MSEDTPTTLPPFDPKSNEARFLEALNPKKSVSQSAPQYFMEVDRERAKIGLSPEQLRYIQALENIANDAYDLWVQLGQDKEKLCAADLYDSLSLVDFMHSGGESNGQ
jgi:hypothetical protein